jgi:hypothetical protein
VLTSDASGNATWQSLPIGIGFAARLTDNLNLTNNVETDLAAFTEIYDDGNGFNAANATFTAPVAGLYQFIFRANFAVPVTAASTTCTFGMKVNGTIGAGNQLSHILGSSTTGWSQGLQIVTNYKLNAGATVRPYIFVNRSGAATHTLVGGSGSNSAYFSASRLY